MKTSARIVVTLGLIGIGLAVLFPPWVFSYNRNATMYAGKSSTPGPHQFLFDPPSAESAPGFTLGSRQFWSVGVDVSRLVLEVGAIAIVANVCLLFVQLAWWKSLWHWLDAYCRRKNNPVGQVMIGFGIWIVGIGVVLWLVGLTFDALSDGKPITATPLDLQPVESKKELRLSDFMPRPITNAFGDLVYSPREPVTNRQTVMKP